VYKGICEKKCDEKKCPTVISRLDKEMRKKLKAAEKRQRKKIEKEQQRLEALGETRNLLLKPEDRKNA
jgi:CelD/BcsL family acetyltransferase involved in cellulose biosynthesis